MTEEEIAEIRGKQVDVSLMDIAIVKGHAYAQGYNTYIGKIEDREGYMYLKQGYTDGFLAGFAHRIGGGYGGG
jgi:hypothetical protein|tara:strand:- start:346 stop:564 length:219 start_codon:yes stop_codon:yes gene_type:complete